MGRRSEIWIPVGILAGAALLAFLVLQNIHRIDPKRKNAPNASSFNKMGAGLAIFITALNFLIIASAFKGAAAFNSFLFPLAGPAICLTIAISVIPAVYSWRLFKNKR